MQLKIERGVPVPENHRTRKHKRSPVVATLAALKINESVVVPSKLMANHSLRTTLHYFRRFTPDRDFAAQTVKGGVRVWRVRRTV